VTDLVRLGAQLSPLTDLQRDIVDTICETEGVANVYVIGGKGAGKSIGTAYAAAWLAYCKAPESDGLAFAPTWQQVKDLIIQKWIEVAPLGCYELCTSGDKKRGPHIKVFHPQAKGKRPKTTVIYLRSGEAPKRVEGLSVGWAWGEEIQDCEELWDLVGDRIRDKNCPRLVRFGAGLPEQGWLEDVFEALPDGRYDPETGTRWVQCSAYDNEQYLPGGFIASRVATLTAEEKRNRVDGLFVSSSDAIYSTFDRRLNVRPCPPDPARDLYLGVDFNNNPMSAAFLQRVGPEWRVVGEVAKRGTTEEHAARLVEWCVERHFRVPLVKVVPDASGSSKQHATGKSDHEMLRQAGFELCGPKANPPIKDRDNAVLKAIRRGGTPYLFVDPSCHQLITAIAKLRNTGRERSPYTHITDCLGYVLHRFDPVIEQGPYPAPLSVSKHAAAASPFRRPGKAYPI
jgi:hypothetical protein